MLADRDWTTDSRSDGSRSIPGDGSRPAGSRTAKNDHPTEKQPTEETRRVNPKHEQVSVWTAAFESASQRTNGSDEGQCGFVTRCGFPVRGQQRRIYTEWQS